MLLQMKSPFEVIFCVAFKANLIPKIFFRPFQVFNCLLECKVLQESDQFCSIDPKDRKAFHLDIEECNKSRDGI